MKNSGRKKFYEICRSKLAEIKSRHVDTLKKLSGELVAENSPDVADQAKQLQDEAMSLARREKILFELREIDEALDRIKRETYGVCEVTGNPIEERRLEMIPWTRLSLEGAEMAEMERRGEDPDEAAN